MLEKAERKSNPEAGNIVDQHDREMVGNEKRFRSSGNLK